MRSRLPIQKSKLSNQAVVLVEENHSTPIVSFCAYFQGGTRRETTDTNGITQLTQKVLLKGSENFSAAQWAFQMESIGAKVVQFTEKDAFGAHVSVLSKHLDKALELFLEAVFHPVFPDEEVEKEKKILLAEIRHSQDEIYAYVQELCDRTLFAQHPYRLPVRGTSGTVQTLNRDALVDWHRQWWCPNNLVFAVVGDAVADRVEEKVASYLQNLSKAKLPKFVLHMESNEGKRDATEEREKRQLAIAIGFLVPPAADEERFTCEVLNGLLSGMGSHLFIELRDKKGLAYSVACKYEPFLDHGILKAIMGTAAEKESQAKEGLLEELMRMRDVVVEEEELNRTKRYLIGLYEIDRQKNSTQARRFARYEMLGLGWRMANQYPKRIEAVQASAVTDLAKRYLDPENFSCAVVRPRLASPLERVAEKS